MLGLPSLSLDGQAELASWREQNETLGELVPATLPASLNILALDWGTLNNKMIGLKFILPLQRKLQDSPWLQNLRSVSFEKLAFPNPCHISNARQRECKLVFLGTRSTLALSHFWAAVALNLHQNKRLRHQTGWLLLAYFAFF